MRNVPAQSKSAEEWQKAILASPDRIHDFIRECYLKPYHANLLQQFYSHGLWGELLVKHPQLADYCNEDYQRQVCLPDYLYSHQEEISEDVLKGLKGGPLEDFIMRCPQHLLACPVENLTSTQLVRLLTAYPEFADRLAFEDFLSEYEWGQLLDNCPDFFERCPIERMPSRILLARLSKQPEVWKTIDKSRISSSTWKDILEKFPYYLGDCDMQQLDACDYGALVWQHPEWHRPELHCKLDELDISFWANRGFFALPPFRKERRWLQFRPKEWDNFLLTLYDLEPTPDIDDAWRYSVQSIGKLDRMSVEAGFKPQDLDRSTIREIVLMRGGERRHDFNRLLNGCLKYTDFKCLEYLLQADRKLVLSYFNASRNRKDFNKMLILCVYAPYSIVCQLLPDIDPAFFQMVDGCQNNMLHYTFLRDPFGDDPETNSIRALLKEMGTPDAPNGWQLTLKELQTLMRHYVKC